MDLRAIAVVTATSFVVATGAFANPFEGGWTLQEDNSTLNFQSTKNDTKVETSAFAQFSGTIQPNGAAEVTVELESVDTGIDLRNVRMRFLFFESFQFPKAVVTAQLLPADLADLNEKRRKIVKVPYVLNLHGVIKTAEADLAVTLLTDNLVNVTTPTPITVATADFNLDGGVQKLEEAAGVSIMPQAAVTFDFTFERNVKVETPTETPADDTTPAEEETVVAEETAPEQPAEENTAEVTVAAEETSQVEEAETTEVAAATPAKTETSEPALEPDGNFSTEACLGRFEILSRTDNIKFSSGSSRLDDTSAPLLNQLVEVVSRCPEMRLEVGGHTDNVGSKRSNQRLSERRARSVVRYLTDRGIDNKMLVAKGYGEAEPAFDNTTAEGRSRNRRIGFKVIE